MSAFQRKLLLTFRARPWKFTGKFVSCEIRFTLVQLFYYFLANMVGFYGF
jgi:hypothetical protein